MSRLTPIFLAFGALTLIAAEPKEPPTELDDWAKYHDAVHDDYVIGKYEHVDKLWIDSDDWTADVRGKGEYVAGFIEAYYDNLDEKYRTNAEWRKEVLLEMMEARKTGARSFELYQQEYYHAFLDTVGRR
jgi:hypothetical protein